MLFTLPIRAVLFYILLESPRFEARIEKNTHLKKCPQNTPPQFLVKRISHVNLLSTMQLTVLSSVIITMHNIHGHNKGHNTCRHKVLIAERHNMVVQFSINKHKKDDLRGLSLFFKHQKNTCHSWVILNNMSKLEVSTPCTF